MSLPTRILVLVLTLMLAGCGFQLRGQVEVPPELERIHISGLSQDNELFRLINNYLGSGGVEIANSPAEAARLRLSQFQQLKDILVVGTDGRVREYRLISGITMSLQGRDGKQLIDSQDIRVFRDFLYDPDNVLAKAEEERILREEMTRELAQQVIARLTALVSH
jgi:LPS-assembly lipoprotein